MVLTADKGDALVIIDKDMYVKNAWPYLMRRKYNVNVKIRPKSIHSKVLKQPPELKKKTPLDQKFKNQYIKLPYSTVY